MYTYILDGTGKELGKEGESTYPSLNEIAKCKSFLMDRDFFIIPQKKTKAPATVGKSSKRAKS
jgi:hypothetical protein